MADVEAELERVGRPRPAAVLIDVPDEALVGRLSETRRRLVAAIA